MLKMAMKPYVWHIMSYVQYLYCAKGWGGKGGGGCNRCCGLVAALALQRMQRSGSRFSATAICIVLGETAVTGGECLKLSFSLSSFVNENKSNGAPALFYKYI